MKDVYVYNIWFWLQEGGGVKLQSSIDYKMITIGYKINWQFMIC